MPDLTDQAWELNSKGDPRAAHRLIRRALRENPSSYRTRCIYAVILDELAWSRRSVEVLRSVLLEYPEDAYAKRTLALSLIHTNQNVEADQILSELVAADPSDSRAHDLLLWNRAGSTSLSSEKDLRALGGTRADAIDTAIYRFEKYLYSFRGRKAIACLKPLAPLQTKDVRVSTSFGKWAIHKGRLDEATKHLMQSVDLDPKNPRTIMLAANLLWKNQCYGAASRWYQRVLLIPGREVVARIYLAQQAIREKNYDAAEWHIKRIEYLQPYSIQTVIIRTRLIAATKGLFLAVRAYFRLARVAFQQQELGDRKFKKG